MPIDTQSKKSGDEELKFQDYSKRILELYDDRSKNFWRSFWVVIALGLFFFFIILLPFVMLQEQNYETNLRLNQTVINITNTNETLSIYKNVESKLKSLRDVTSGGAEDLLKYINNASSSYDNVTAALPPALEAVQRADSPSKQINNLGHPACIDSAWR